nr:thiamine pyrophosphate-dependent enzyme [Corynebacterium lactis]
MAIATTTCGAGFTNALTTLAEAKAARIPLVLVTGTHPAAARPFDLNQSGMLDALGVCYLTASPSSALSDAHIAAELAAFLREPVVVQIPFDIQDSPLIDGGDTPKNIHLMETATSAHGASSAQHQRPLHNDGDTALDTPSATVEDVARLLLGARRPLIVAGRGVHLSGTADIVRSIGDSVGALFMHSAMARHVVDSPWELGTVGGFAHSWQHELARQADVVLVLGASLNAFQCRGGNMFGHDATIVHILDEPHPASLPASIRMFSDLEDILPVLRDLVAPDRLPARDSRDSSSWRAQLGSLDAHRPERIVESATCADGRLDPRACLQLLDQLLPQRRSVCTDGGHFLGWVPKFLDVPGPANQVIVGTAIQSIGMGLGSLVGVAAARPEDYCVLVAGDGGGMMGLADLGSAIASLNRGAIVFMNDAAYGAELHQYSQAGLDTSSMVIEDCDFAALGEAFSATGFTIRTEEDFALLRDYFAALSAEPQPGERAVAVIDFKISRSVVADFVKEVLAKK